MKRRVMTGRALLVASSTVVLGCSGGAVSGNLVAPPMVELCVNATPAEAAVAIDGLALEEDGCNHIYQGTHELTATAEGYQDYAETVDVLEDTTLDITLTADTP